MQENNDFISAKEHSLLRLTAIAAFGITILRGVIAVLTAEPPREGSHFTIASMFDHYELTSPVYSFFGLFFSCIFLLKIGMVRIVFSFFITLLLFCFYLSWLIATQRSLLIFRASPESFEVNLSVIDYILIGSNVYDVISFIFTSILFVWQTKIIFRIISINRKLPLK